MAVDAAFFQASGLHEVGKGRALEALLVEESRRVANDILFGFSAFGHGFPQGLKPRSFRFLRRG
jgi:hypothetical protein